MNTEDHLRNRIATTWTALQSTKSGSKQELDAFRLYCEALDQASCYAAERVRLTTGSEGASPMRIALRVLAAVNERRAPSASDVATLRGIVPKARDLAPDELACEVIQQEMRRRVRPPCAAGES